MSLWLIATEGGGCAWPLETDTAPVPTGDYGVDWAVVSRPNSDLAEDCAQTLASGLAEPCPHLLSETAARAAFAGRDAQRT